MRIRSMTVAGFWVAAFVIGAIALNGVGCGDDESGPSGPDPVTVTGDVNSAADETAAAPVERRWFSWLQPSDAVAQQSCQDVTILACLRTDVDADTPTVSCSPVSRITCEFEVAIDLDGTVEIFFVDDDGDGTREDGEAVAEFQGEPETFCNGQTLTLSNVDISFVAMTAVASGGVESDIECPTPTATPEPTATPTPTPEPTASPSPEG